MNVKCLAADIVIIMNQCSDCIIQYIDECILFGEYFSDI